MTLTEEEAKTKWCPYAFTFGKLLHGTDQQSHGPQNRGATVGGALHNCLCIASQCMAWRPYESESFKAKADDEYARTGKRLTPPGFCGLAGKP